MKRLADLLSRLMRGLSMAVSRFPLTVICLVCAAVLVCYMISLHKDPGLFVQKLMFTFVLGAFLGIVAQFSYERFGFLKSRRLVVYVLSALLTAGYYLILWPASDISFEVLIRTFVAIFALFCAFLWVPAYRSRADFNVIALTHFKAVFTAVLYSGVLAAGCAAIIAAVDTLLFRINPDTYGYMMTIVWVLFAPIYYLSLLPCYNSTLDDDREYLQRAGEYPRFLEILISYIAIPLLTAYTLVLAAYFIKIMVTMKWPSGQLGVMVLAYSAAGLIIYVLACLLTNRFAIWYRRLFPKVLIPVVIMQLISVAIRLNAYGVTESRYYVVLFGIFSLVCGILLSFMPVTRNGVIALLAAGFAIFSVIPPVDTFTVSRVSQISRLERMLAGEGVLANGKITPKSDVTLKLKTETTNILSYLERRKYIKYVTWLPTGFVPDNNSIKTTLGFEPTYSSSETNNLFANLDTRKPFSTSGYDVCINTFVNRGMVKPEQPVDFEIKGVKYQLGFERVSDQDVRIQIKNAAGAELVGTGLYDFAKSFSGVSSVPKDAYPPEKMTLDVEQGSYKLRIVFQNINITYGSSYSGADYGLYILFGTK